MRCNPLAAHRTSKGPAAYVNSRDGGLGIHITTSQAEAEFSNSAQATAPLKELILEQRLSIDDERAGRFISDSKEAKSDVVKKKRKIQSTEKESACGNIPENERRLFDEISSGGASSWLTALPLKEHGFVLNKQQFHDALLDSSTLHIHYRNENTVRRRTVSITRGCKAHFFS